MKIQVITLFPEMFEGVLNTSMLWKAQDKKLVEYKLINLRDFGMGPRKQVDDTPYGGGDGMVLRVEPLVAAIQHAKSLVASHQSLVVLMTPRGKRFDQAEARELSKLKDIILVCARYEGYDERVIEFVDEEISIGDYVLTGGELPAMVVVDAVTRLIPGVLGGETSAERESHREPGIIEHPQYTRPEKYRGLKVPEVLLSGHHVEIQKWRDNQSKKS
ncbi:tRNA (guanosine(37)-N1)-methyltransferase TrmD [Candidatus Gottesmanbacteria bacterium RIFCSPHIGHO2_01_FULL_42_12]|uniref:tRNA (guanine-N(1)-)-methyltransferase n=1 Tax=Candidatus Gottesmanbacteria bacterium RIFCSPHIGHO2_01_FULL_42_12 TaxID=1798377 RepID=A0A1F5Z5A2_9BACT|nr:MAG: tRNA (guanosine(37)-N1)-methyltransferase TrmD [Candidatus Gottesmanbacteria bacterium RIFCSPHIGHO2_01_FULL_42_12]